MNHVYFLYTNILWNNGCLQTKNTYKQRITKNGEITTKLNDFSVLNTGIDYVYGDLGVLRLTDNGSVCTPYVNANNKWCISVYGMSNLTSNYELVILNI